MCATKFQWITAFFKNHNFVVYKIVVGTYINIGLTWAQVSCLICGLGSEGVHIRQNMNAHVITTCYVTLQLCMSEHQLKSKTVTSFIYRDLLDLIMALVF